MALKAELGHLGRRPTSPPKCSYAMSAFPGERALERGFGGFRVFFPGHGKARGLEIYGGLLPQRVCLRLSGRVKEHGPTLLDCQRKRCAAPKRSRSTMAGRWPRPLK